MLTKTTNFPSPQIKQLGGSLVHEGPLSKNASYNQNGGIPNGGTPRGGVPNNDKQKKLRVEFSIEDNFSGIQESILKPFRNPYLSPWNKTKQKDYMYIKLPDVYLREFTCELTSSWPPAYVEGRSRSALAPPPISAESRKQIPRRRYLTTLTMNLTHVLGKRTQN